MYKNLAQALSFYELEYDKPYYIASEKTIYKFPKNVFRVDFYVFCICTGGKMTVEIDNKKHLITANNFIITAPATNLKFRKKNKNFKMKVLFFEKFFLLKNISNPFIIEKMELFQNSSHSIVATQKKEVKNINYLLDYLKQKKSKQGKFTSEIARSIIINLLFEIAEITAEKNNASLTLENSISNIYLKFRSLIQKHILEEQSVQFYALKLNISNKYLIEIVKKSSNKTPHEIIDEMLLKEAYVLLGDTSLTISEIAFKLNFNSSSSFGRFFKKQTNLRPSDYRAEQCLTP